MRSEENVRRSARPLALLSAQGPSSRDPLNDGGLATEQPPADEAPTIYTYPTGGVWLVVTGA